MNIYILIIIAIGIFSCNKKYNCIKSFKDTGSIKGYLIVKDTCNVFEKKSHESYYINDTLIMAGYGNRFVKQGVWEYYNKGEKITQGKFNNSSPLGIWNYKNFGNIEWVKKENTDEGYQLSLPKSWKIIKLDQNSMDAVNDTNLSKFNVKIEINIQKEDVSIDNLYINLSNKFKKENKESFKIKKWVTLDGINTFEFEIKSKFGDGSVFNTNSIYFKLNNKIYSISIYVREGSNYAYEIIKEQIMWSFRMNENPSPNKKYLNETY